MLLFLSCVNGSNDWIVAVDDTFYETITGILHTVEEMWDFVVDLPSQIAAL
jgi:hypothetical protein